MDIARPSGYCYRWILRHGHCAPFLWLSSPGLSSPLSSPGYPPPPPEFRFAVPLLQISFRTKLVPYRYRYRWYISPRHRVLDYIRVTSHLLQQDNFLALFFCGLAKLSMTRRFVGQFSSLKADPS